MMKNEHDIAATTFFKLSSFLHLNIAKMIRRRWKLNHLSHIILSYHEFIVKCYFVKVWRISNIVN